MSRKTVTGHASACLFREVHSGAAAFPGTFLCLSPHQTLSGVPEHASQAAQGPSHHPPPASQLVCFGDFSALSRTIAAPQSATTDHPQ